MSSSLFLCYLRWTPPHDVSVLNCFENVMKLIEFFDKRNFVLKGGDHVEIFLRHGVVIIVTLFINLHYNRGLKLQG